MSDKAQRLFESIAHAPPRLQSGKIPRCLAPRCKPFDPDNTDCAKLRREPCLSTVCINSMISDDKTKLANTLCLFVGVWSSGGENRSLAVLPKNQNVMTGCRPPYPVNICLNADCAKHRWEPCLSTVCINLMMFDDNSKLANTLCLVVGREHRF